MEDGRRSTGLFGVRALICISVMAVVTGLHHSSEFTEPHAGRGCLLRCVNYVSNYGKYIHLTFSDSKLSKRKSLDT